MKCTHLLQETEEAEVSLNPMIDMVFILLVFFIVATVFVDEQGFSLQRPSIAPIIDSKVSEPLTFSIDKHGQIHFEDRIVDLHTVTARTAQFHQQHPKESVTVETHAQVSANSLLTTCDAIRKSGVTDVVLLEAN